ncbi:MAG: response regulator [Chthoniobacteraceae bacterium]
MPEATSSPSAPGELRLSLLFVEDHEATAVIMAKLLRRRGHIVVMASSCAEAMAAAVVQKFDCLISDLTLPDGSGHDLMRAMRECYAITGIAVSGSGDEADIEQALASGFSRHFTKPIDIDRLQQALLEVASESRA